MENEDLTKRSTKFILDLDVPGQRAIVNDLLLQTSELVRRKGKKVKSQNEPIKKG
ncbi:hypothetical protein [Domibacillus epiphyticus]|uniref:hypothetical protein n=1 Tax=Domibacillus epiphyticus TaxID=1714355 RepID=UPI0038B70ED3